MTKEKKFTAQTVRVPVEIEKALGHLLVETGESFQALALRLVQSEIANLGKPLGTNPGDPPIPKEIPRVLPSTWPAVLGRIAPAVTALIQDGRGGLADRVADLLDAIAGGSHGTHIIPESSTEELVERARAVGRRALGNPTNTPRIENPAGTPRKPKKRAG